MVRIFYAVGLMVLISACGPSEFPEYTQLGPLRLLALVASTPETYPGLPVTLTPVVSDLNGGTRTLKYEAEWCLDPGLDRGAEPRCASADGSQTGALSLIQGGDEKTGAATALTLTIPSTLLDGKSDAEKLQGIYYFIQYKLIADDGTQVTSYRRILVSAYPIKNQNPPAPELRIEGGSRLTELPSGGTPAYATFSAGANESFLSPAGTKTEILTTTWFYSDGSFKRYRTEDQGTNTYSPPNTRPSNRQIVLVAITRDSRGGESFSIVRM